MQVRQVPPTEFIRDLKLQIKSVNLEGVKALLQEAENENYDLNINDPQSRFTFIHFAISRASNATELGMLDIIKALKSAGCDVNIPAQESFRHTPLHTASRRALPDIVVWLINNGANIEARDNTHQTALDYIEKHIHANGVQMSPEIRKRLDDVRSFLMDARAQKRAETVQFAKQICAFGLFTAAFLGSTVVISTEIYNRYTS